VRLYHTFEDDAKVHCAMQLCGSELVPDGPVPEPDVQALAKQLFRALRYLHTVAYIAHRDLKMENLMLKSAGMPLSQNTLKVIDFGFAQGFRPGVASFSELCGTPGYMAQEVLCENMYDEKCDLFSCGAIIYKLVSGELPFKPKDAADGLEDAFDEAFFLGRPDFTGEVWSVTCPELQDLIRQLCTQEPRQRLSAEAALENEWFTDCDSPEADGLQMCCRRSRRRITRSLEDLALKEHQAVENEQDALKAFCKEALVGVAYNLEDNELDGEQSLFEFADKDGDGQLSEAELTDFCTRLGLKEEIAAQLADRLFETGSIGYTEFLHIAIQGRECQFSALRASFAAFDLDADGKISAHELQTCLNDDRFSHQDIRQAIAAIDEDHDGEVNFQEFVNALPLKLQVGNILTRGGSNVSSVST